MEARAIKTVFSEHATSGTLAFSSTKVKMLHDSYSNDVTEEFDL